MSAADDYTVIRHALTETFAHEDEWRDASGEALESLDALRDDRDAWRRVAREYESALADRNLL